MNSSRSALRCAALIVGSAVLVGCQEQILHDLTEYEANKVISRLSESDISPSKVLQADGRWAVSVSKQSVVRALAVVDSSRILAARLNAPTASSKSGLIPNRHEQWYLYVQSIAQSLEQSLHAIPGVLEARVHLNMPESDPLIGRGRDQVGSGSVLLLINGDFRARDEEIAALVSGAAGMPSSSIRVLRSLARGVREQGEESLPTRPGDLATDRAPVTTGEDTPGKLSGATTGEGATARGSVAQVEEARQQDAASAVTSLEVLNARATHGMGWRAHSLGIIGGAAALALVCLVVVVVLLLRRRTRGAHFPIERGEV